MYIEILKRNGKPFERLGRKATGLSAGYTGVLAAGLPNEESRGRRVSHCLIPIFGILHFGPLDVPVETARSLGVSAWCRLICGSRSVDDNGKSGS